MNELSITVAGNVVGEVRVLGTGQARRATFRLAFNSRRWDSSAGNWTDGPTQYYSVWCRARLAENVLSCLGKGMPVIVRGKLVVREVEAAGQEGQGRRTYVDIDAHHVGIDLARGAATFTTTKTAAVVAAEDRAVAEALAAAAPTRLAG
jgi:single-strand DNA-binding protein